MVHIHSYAQHSIPDTYIMKISTTWRLLSNKDITAAIITLAYDNNQKVIIALINAFINTNNLMNKSPRKNKYGNNSLSISSCASSIMGSTTTSLKQSTRLNQVVSHSNIRIKISKTSSLCGKIPVMIITTLKQKWQTTSEITSKT